MNRERTQLAQDIDSMIRGTQAKLSELGVTRAMLREHLRGLGV